MANAFRLEETEGNVAILTFDVPDSKVNTFSRPVMAELEAVVGRLEVRSDLAGLLFRSGKPGQFIAGADLRELAALASLTREQAAALLASGHALFSRISELPFPTVALVDGPCMGGGTELILAMDERLASTGSRTQIALPETKIGIIPGWGGTQRLPRLIGVPHAINMITSGEPVWGPEAARLGLVFDAVPPERLQEEGRRIVELLREGDRWKEQRQRRRQPVGMTADQLTFATAVAEGMIAEKTKGQYPAPLVALRAIREGCSRPLEEGLRVEQERCLEVAGSEISANLIAMFFMNQRLERDPGIADARVQPSAIGRAGVLGAGLMGSGIATALARSGLATAMVDVDDARVNAGLERAKRVVADRIQAKRASLQDMADMLARLNTSVTTNVFADADIVIEAIVENESAKTAAYRQIAGILKQGAILASNTSTISITRLAQSAPNPERFVGMHFFNPVDRMKLVEVIRGEKTSDETVATVVALARRARKLPIVVRDCAGFLVNRVLFPYLSESLVLLLEGASMDAIDKAATRFGMPMGPILLFDVVGVDTACYAGQVVYAAYPDRALALPILADLVAAGRLGQKSGSGFRKFPPKKMKGEADPAFEPFLAKYRTGDRQPSDEEIVDRLFLPMLVETARCVEEGIVRDPADADMGLVLGIGFPAFRGGILRWCDSLGAGEVLGRLERYRSLGKRFEPPDLLRKQAATGTKFYLAPRNLAT